MNISNRTAVITGGVSGLGKATACAILDRGGKVAIIDINENKIQEIKDELGGSIEGYAVDVASEKDIEAVVSKVLDKFDSIEFVINCAGIAGSERIINKEGVVMSLENFERRIRINLVGTFNVIRASFNSIIKNTPNEEGERGVYINTASIAAFDGQVGQSSYSASKGGIVSMTISLAREFADNGIRVMAIVPGIFNTPLLAKNPDKVLERLSRQVPFPPRLGKPKEFAELVCHIIENPYLNGECIRLDGGLRMGFGRK